MIKKINEVDCFLAGDLTHLRELLHPKNDKLQLGFSLAHAYLELGEKSLPHRLLGSSETYFVLEGQGEICIDNQCFALEKAVMVHVPANALQSVRNTGDSRLSFLCIVSPPWAPECDEVVDEEKPNER